MQVRDRHWTISAAAAVAAVLMHLAFVAPLLVGSQHRRQPPPEQPGAGATTLLSSAALVEALTVIDLLHLQSSASEHERDELSSFGVDFPRSALVIANPDPTSLPFSEDEAADDAKFDESLSDTQGHAAMLGRYLGQISARIERTWRRPRTAIGAERFTCQVMIEQDRRGRVLSVELRRCNGDSRWQQSLVSAIEHASPLPAPPIPSVFTSVLALRFSADIWQEGISNAHRYEPRPPADDSMRMSVLRVAASSEGGLEPGGSIELRIEGTKVTWKQQSAPATVTGAADEFGAGNVDAYEGDGEPQLGRSSSAQEAKNLEPLRHEAGR